MDLQEGTGSHDVAISPMKGNTDPGGAARYSPTKKLRRIGGLHQGDFCRNL